jgi:hypothetical protein
MLVGRVPELRELLIAGSGARLAGRGWTSLIGGDAGIGKTRLAAEFADASTPPACCTPAHRPLRAAPRADRHRWHWRRCERWPTGQRAGRSRGRAGSARPGPAAGEFFPPGRPFVLVTPHPIPDLPSPAPPAHALGQDRPATAAVVDDVPSDATCPSCGSCNLLDHRRWSPRSGSDRASVALDDRFWGPTRSQSVITSGSWGAAARWRSAWASRVGLRRGPQHTNAPVTGGRRGDQIG